MTVFQKVTPGEALIGRLRFGSDLLGELLSLCIENNICLGRIEAIGAVQKARLAFYDQQTKKYQFREFNKPMEIVQLIGNISLKEEKPFVHAHLTVSDESGTSFGGHLSPGTIVFAGEFIIQPFIGPAISRKVDGATGLQLWEMH